MSQHEPSLTQNTVGALVRMHRVARGLTQQALARLCQLSPISIAQIEQGVRIPSVTACRAFAAALPAAALGAAGLPRHGARRNSGRAACGGCDGLGQPHHAGVHAALAHRADPTAHHAPPAPASSGRRR